MANLTIDPDQIFTKNVNLNLITKEINYSSNKYIRKFIEINKHLDIDDDKKEEFINKLYEDQMHNINHTGHEIIRLHGIDIIKKSEYFRCILSACNDNNIINFILNNNIIFRLNGICLNSNDKAVDYIFENIINKLPQNKNIYYEPEGVSYDPVWLIKKLSQNENDRIVDYLIKNPEKIDINSFLLNKNPKAIQYCYNKY